MRMLAALTAGWIFAESLPGAQFAGPAGGLWGSGGGTLGFLWLAAGVAWSVACLMKREGGAGWARLLALAVGAWLPNGLLETPYFRLGPVYGGTLLWVLGAILWFKGESSNTEETPASKPRASELAFLFLSGLAAALPLIALWRVWVRLGQNEPADRAIGLPVLLTLFAIGAFAFGRMVPARSYARGKGWALGILGFASLFALHSAESLATNRGLRTLVRRFGLDLSDAGTYLYDALVGVSLWVLPAFFAGMLWFCTENRRQRLAFGAGWLAALAAQPLLLNHLAQNGVGQGATQGLLGFGAGCCALGAAWILWASRLRMVGTIFGLALLAAAARYPYQPLEIAKPWSRTVKDVLWSKDYPAGQLAVYNEGPTGFSARLDQRAITPVLEFERLEQRLLLHSMALLAPERRQGSRVLLAGLLTPLRLQVLAGQGAQAIDRIGWDLGPDAEAEKALFGGRAVPEVGSFLSQAQASERAKAGNYDLILVLPAGCPPSVQSADCVQVQWFLVDEALAEWPSTEEPWMLAADGLQRFAAARVTGAGADWVAPRGATRIALGPIASIAPRRVWQTLREWERIDAAREAFFARLGKAAVDVEQRELFAALRELQAAQRHSSPFENEAQRLEMSSELAERVSQALFKQTPDPFVEELAGGLARVLVGKREIAGLFRWVPALSEALGKPYELERSLARAERESLDPAAAAARLEALHHRFPEDADLQKDLAEAFDQTGRWTESTPLWSGLLAQSPADDHLERSWVQAAFLGGDPQGVEARESWLRRHPEDEAIRNLSQSGPQLAPEAQFTPQNGHQDGDNHDEDPH